MWDIERFPPADSVETKKVLKQCASAGRLIAELKGVSQSIPNQAILINTLSLQEAKDSSAIENIVTTHDDLFRGDLFPESVGNLAAKEVQNYIQALKTGFGVVKDSGLITLRTIQAIQEELERNRAGFRKLPGTELRNDTTGETVYMPPQHPETIQALMARLESFINGSEFDGFDPLVRMALMHHQFESIHPFYDGNGRTGRILNVLFLVKSGLLDIPVLYLSRYFIRDKARYYRELQRVRTDGEWEPWILYMLEAVESTARLTLSQVAAIKDSFENYKQRIRNEYPKIYSQDLINNLFNHPYTKIEFIERDLGVSRLTATKYLDSLSGPFLTKQKVGRYNYYINRALFDILKNEQ